jgi:DNA-binding NtrC family response regulator
LNYAFPGNVRELKSLVELAAVIADGDLIKEKDIMIESNGNFTNLLTTESTLHQYEIQIIEHFLEKYDRDILLVAQKLDVGKSTIYRMIKDGEIKAK